MNLNLQLFKRPITRELIFTLVTFLFLIPKPYLTIPELDASWQVALEEAFFKGWEFGATVNFTGGPLSFLYTPTSLGYYVFPQIAAESAILIGAIFLIFRSMREQAMWMLILAFFSLIISAAVGKDGLYLVSVAAGAFTLLRNKTPRISIYLIPAYIALLGLMKFSFASLGIVCVTTLSVGSILFKNPHKAYKMAGSYVGSFLLIWVVIGQNLKTIPGFFINSLQISQGYLWNMNLHEPLPVFYFLVYFLLITSVPIFLICLARRQDVNSWLSLIIAAGTIYLSWKAGLTRAGSHMSFFLQASLVVSFLILPLLKRKKLSILWVSILSLSYAGGFAGVYNGGAKHIATRTWNSLTENLAFLVNPDSLNQTYTNIIPLVLAERELPEVKARVGDASIDVLHYQQAILLLNGLNYQPRPTVQNYPAYNHYLSHLNLKHMQNNPPEFLLMRWGLVDQRYPYCDDSLYNLEVFQNYKPLLGEKGYMLMQRTSNSQFLKEDSVILERTIQSGENVSIAEFSDQLLWLRVDYKPSLFHRITAFFYKPEILIIRVTLENGTHKNFRLVGGNLEDGFLLNPLLEGNVALERFLNTHAPETKITSFTIASIPGQSWFPTKYFDLELSVLKSEATP